MDETAQAPEPLDAVHPRTGTPEGVAESAAVGEPLRARTHGESHHPSPRQYVMIGLWLSIITIIEVALYYLEDQLRGLLVASLLGLMALKFLIVVRSYMHLKYDNPGYGRVFITGLTLAVVVYAVVLATFGIFV